MKVLDIIITFSLFTLGGVAFVSGLVSLNLTGLVIHYPGPRPKPGPRHRA